MTPDFETAHAMQMWREGEAVDTGAYAATHQAEEYARAIALVLDALQRFTTLHTLVDSWYDKRAEAVLDVVCSLPSRRALHVGIVEDTAYWRRWQQLVQEDAIPTVRISREFCQFCQCPGWGIGRESEGAMGKKRGQGAGSVVKRADGRYMVRLPIDGVRRTIGYAKTAEAADRMLTAAKHERDRGVPYIADSITLADFAAEWLAMKEPDLKESTYRSYEGRLRVHILPTLGKVPLKKLTTVQVQRLLSARRGAPVPGHKAHMVSATTVRRAHAVLHTLLEDARRLGHVTINVADNVTPPKVEHHEMCILSREQVAAFLDTTEEDRLAALYILELTTGMRQGELLALKWAHVDLSAGVLRVVATLYRRKAGDFTFTRPKTRDSARTVVLAPVAVEALRAHRARQAQERLRLGVCWQDLNLVFPAEDGSPLDCQSLTRYHFHRALERAGLPRIRFHDLRHTYATLMREQGMDIKGVSAALGHSSTAITQDLYMHVTAAMQRQLADAAEAIVRRRKASQ
jgi:integrase